MYVCRMVYVLEKEEMLKEKFEFREIRQDEIEQAVRIEQICFPPHEACKEEHMTERIQKVPELFFVAVDKENGKVAGFLNGIATSEEKFRDEFFTDADLNEPAGKHVMLLGLDVLPEYRRKGIACALTSRLALEILKEGKVPFYCCAWSNIKSAGNAIKSGFRPAWVEMTVKPASFVDEMNK